MKPAFQKREVVVLKPNTEERFGGGDPTQTIATVMYVGAETKGYKAGDKILFDMISAKKELTIFGDTLCVIQHEDSVTCKIDENE